MMKLFLTLALAPFFAHAAPESVTVHFEYQRDKDALCRTELRLESGEEYLACEIRIKGQRAFLRTKVENEPGHERREYLFRLKVEVLGDDGKISTWSNPSISVLEGETARMEMGEPGKPETWEALSATVTRN